MCLPLSVHEDLHLEGTGSSPQVSPPLEEEGGALIPGVLGKHGDLIVCGGHLCAWVVGHHGSIASAGLPAHLHLRSRIPPLLVEWPHRCRIPSTSYRDYSGCRQAILLLPLPVYILWGSTHFGL